MKRYHNEDSFLVMPEEQLYCVADGMGGHFAGEIASKIAIDELAEFFRLTSGLGVTRPFMMDKTRNYDENRLATGIKPANACIFEIASGDPNYRGWAPPSPRCTCREVGLTSVTGTAGFHLTATASCPDDRDHPPLNDHLKASSGRDRRPFPQERHRPRLRMKTRCRSTSAGASLRMATPSCSAPTGSRGW